ncbi:hypothetical protein GQ607_016218 [Colletotrichum asianum]|uniref:Uncharacterized protein n=1 Tax=Colletotrichum asianum TaxID=702518 RepID=A0A8H3VZJ2_9PEZI|nr:hypothetical protein GQ607_016218 [Colletotrichum asianum]
MRNRLSLQTWVDSTPTMPQSEPDEDDWRHRLEAMTSAFTQDTLSRNGYDEEKCRNVLVRYCAHIPRNYQYRDGIQLVFLVLREHLGDENLDLAGGVLYELIEIDCQHSDDPGAEFQRWKYDHLNRHSNLELPHIPHMSTITTSIRPTLTLVEWRQKHSSRYPIRLSDHYFSARASSIEPSCIRSRKAWMIDHTMYVSTREGGTCAFRSPKPKELHEMQWDMGIIQAGRFIKEEEVTPKTASFPMSDHRNSNNIVDADTSQAKASKNSKTGLLFRALRQNHIAHIPSGTEARLDNKRRSWLTNIFGLDTVLTIRDFVEPKQVPLPDGCMTPHAIFARKFSLVADGLPLPSSLSRELMPTADIKARKVLVEAAAEGFMDPS